MATFRKATRTRAKLRAAFIGPAGSGKTYSALSVGCNLVPGGRVALIDSECGSAELYADRFQFDTLALTKHSPLDYVDAIIAACAEGYDVTIVDSLSHAWIGRDGALEQVDKAADRDPRGNNFTAWRTVTPKHNKLVDTMISCPTHLIVTLRAKTEFVQEKNPTTGKTEIRKIGLAPVQRDGLEYEFSLVGDLDLSNQLKISKTRLDGVVSPGDIIERPGAAFAKKIYSWLMSGSESVAPTRAVETTVAAAVDSAFADYLAGMSRAGSLRDLDAAATGPGRPAKGTTQHAMATEAYLRAKAQIEALDRAQAERSS